MPFKAYIGVSTKACREAFIQDGSVLEEILPRVVTAIACVSPLVNRALPWTLGSSPQREYMSLTS